MIQACNVFVRRGAYLFDYSWYFNNVYLALPWYFSLIYCLTSLVNYSLWFFQNLSCCSCSLNWFVLHSFSSLKSVRILYFHWIALALKAFWFSCLKILNSEKALWSRVSLSDERHETPWWFLHRAPNMCSRCLLSYQKAAPKCLDG